MGARICAAKAVLTVNKDIATCASSCVFVSWGERGTKHVLSILVVGQQVVGWSRAPR